MIVKTGTSEAICILKYTDKTVKLLPFISPWSANDLHYMGIEAIQVHKERGFLDTFFEQPNNFLE